MKKGTLSRRTRINSRFHYCLVSLLSLAILSPYLFLPLPASARGAKAERLNSSNSSSESSSKTQPLAVLPTAKPAPLKESVAQPQAAPIVAGPGRIIFGAGGVLNGFLMTNTDSTNTVSLTDIGSGQIQHPSVSAQTGMIAFDAQSLLITPALPQHARRIFVMNGDGSGVRQITFEPGGDPLFNQDKNPEISPDGTKVAFISARTAGQPHTCTNVNQTVTTTNEVWVVNVDGTNLQQVTHPKFLDDVNFGCDISNNYAVAWSSDSQHLAVLGRRKYTFTKTNVGVSHMYTSISIDDADTGIAYNFGTLDGGDKEPVKKARIANPGFIDWSPSSTILFEANLGGASGEDSVSIGYLSSGSGAAICGVDGGGPGGGGGGGFADCVGAQTLMGQVGFGGSTDGLPHGGQIFPEPGSVRYSPDGSALLIAGVSPLAGNGLVPTVFVGGGSAPIIPSQNSGWLHEGLAWAPGPVIPAPASLTLTPNPVVVWLQHQVQITPTLRDAGGNTIVRAALWRNSVACPTCGIRCDNTPDEVPCTFSHLSDSDVDFTGKYTGRDLDGKENLCASNAGLRACTVIENYNSASLSVAATTPIAFTSGTGGPGVFSIKREGNPNLSPVVNALPFNFSLGGTAQRDVDYTVAFTGNTVTFAAGQPSVDIHVRPLRAMGDKTVIITLLPDQQNSYILDSRNTATITIKDDGVQTPKSKKTGVFRPTTGELFLKNVNSSGFADTYIIFGNPGDYPVAGDWNGDGADSVGIYRNGVFYLRNTNSTGFADIVVPFGSPGDQPIAGDWNGDGVDTIGIYRNGTFYLRNSNTAGPPDLVFTLGNPGDVGIAGDWNGDGVTTCGVFRPSNGIIFLKNSNSTGFADLFFVFGNAGDKPVAGDWNGDGIDTVAIYRNGLFFLTNSNTTGFADIVFVLGNSGDFPIAGNWDGSP